MEYKKKGKKESLMDERDKENTKFKETKNKKN